MAPDCMHHITGSYGARSKTAIIVVVARCTLAVLSILYLTLILLFFIHGSYTASLPGAGDIVNIVAVSLMPERNILVVS